MNEKELFLKENGYYVSTPSGRSMRPFIKGGVDVVTVLPLDGEAALFDAVLYYRSNGEHVIHRIVWKKKDLYLIRGDNCYYTERVPKERVSGVVHTIQRGEKTVSVKTGGYRLAVFIWHMIYPLRFLMHGAYRCLVRIQNRARGRKNTYEEKT